MVFFPSLNKAALRAAHSSPGGNGDGAWSVSKGGDEMYVTRSTRPPPSGCSADGSHFHLGF